MKDWIESVMNSMGYPGIGLLMFLENIFPPIPSELVMPAAGFAAYAGTLTLWGVVLAGIAGSVLGQLPLYYLGRVIGQRRLRRWADDHGRWLLINAASIDQADMWFHRYGSSAVFFCRLVPGLRSLISIPAGVAKMNLVSFLIWTALGTAIWTSTLAVLGYLLGQNYDRIDDYMGPINTAIAIVVVVAIAGFVVHRRRSRRAPADSEEQASS